MQRVLHLTLVPLSIGHVALLAGIDSPFLNHKREATLVDLSDAVMICSAPWKEAASMPEKLWFPLFLKAWAFRCRKLDFAAEAEKFESYLAENMEFPATKSAAPPGEMGSAWWLRLMAVMMSIFHLTREQALNYPVLEAANLYAAKLEGEGKIKLWNENDESFDQFCKEMDAKEDLVFPE